MVKQKPIDRSMLDLYSDYLISSFSMVTATGMSAASSGGVGHDKVTKFLSAREYTNKDLWKLVKPVVREIESDDGVLVVDDTIEEKQYTDENDIIAWHYDHVFGRSVKGVNILNLIYRSSLGTVPIGFTVVKKDKEVVDPKTGKKKRISTVTKNEHFRSLFALGVHNNIKFKYVLGDSWFSAQENMEYIRKKDKHFIFALKSNRLFSRSKQDKLNGIFQAVSDIDYTDGQALTGYLKGMDMPVEITRQIFTNEDGSVGTLYLVTSDLTLGHTEITTIYKERWCVEEYHKSTKSNLGLAKSPTKRVTTQINHFFAVAYSYHKLERLSRAVNLNQFALKSRLYIKAIQAGAEELKVLRESARLAVGAG